MDRRGGYRLSEPSGWAVELTGDRISVIDHTGASRTLFMADLSAVAIETNDQGPFGADLWWLLFGPDDRVALSFPQEADGQKAAVDRLMALPGFDFETMVSAMGSTENAFFPLWRRKP